MKKKVIDFVNKHKTDLVQCRYSGHDKVMYVPSYLVVFVANEFGELPFKLGAL